MTAIGSMKDIVESALRAIRSCAEAVEDVHEAVVRLEAERDEARHMVMRVLAFTGAVLLDPLAPEGVHKVMRNLRDFMEEKPRSADEVPS